MRSALLAGTFAEAKHLLADPYDRHATRNSLALAPLSTGGYMEKTLVVCIATLICCGCRGSNVSGPDEIRPAGKVVQVVLINGLDDGPDILTRSNLIRVGEYHDFRLYDSLWISVKATRLTSELPFDEFRLRFGPTHDLRDSVFTIQEDVRFSVKVSDISKPGFCAMSFSAIDSRTVLRLADLRVIGWKTE